MAGSFLHSLTRHVPPGQLGRYLLVGVWNTAFGYTTFAVFTALLRNYIPASYMAAGLISSVLNITVSFLGYKWFVFKTKGNYLREYLKYYVVYGASAAGGVALLAVLVSGLGVNVYVAQACILCVQTAMSFAGHRRFSFR